jgi:hypothetical protein
MESRRVGQIDVAHAGQGMKELRFELPALVGGDGLRASVTRYPPGEQGSGYRLRRDVLQGDGFRPACKAIYCRKAVSEAVCIGSGPTMSMCSTGTGM